MLENESVNPWIFSGPNSLMVSFSTQVKLQVVTQTKDIFLVNFLKSLFCLCVLGESERWWFQIVFIFTLFGEMIQFDKYFSNGWFNHQLGEVGLTVDPL